MVDIDAVGLGEIPFFEQRRKRSNGSTWNDEGDRDSLVVFEPVLD